MGIEIERRFLVDGRDSKPWRSDRKSHIFQVYLRDVKIIDNNIVWDGQNLASLDSEISNIASWRIRLIGEEAILTAKGNKIGSRAEEFEWDLPLEIYNNLAIDGLPSISKIRYYWTGNDGMLWEIDEFESPLSGIIIAEVELEDENQNIEIPDWVGLEVTHLRGWSNASLSIMIEDSKPN